MKSRLDASMLRSWHDRGTSRTPLAVTRFMEGARGECSIRGPFPHGRFWLWMELRCPRLATEPVADRVDFVDLQVRSFYQGVVPWLAYGAGDSRANQRATDLVDLIDELMQREHELYAAGVAWPLAEVIGVFADIVTTIVVGSKIDTWVLWDEQTQGWLAAQFTEVCSTLEAHQDCCPDISINVHWW